MYHLTGLGACQEVGRSAFVLDFGEKFLLDYGVKLEPDTITYPLDIKRNLKALIVSHAHLDHSGLLPYYYENSKCLSFMTQPTLELADILWKDSLKIAKLEGLTPKFSEREIEKTHKYNFFVPYKKRVHISEEVSLEFFDAGHILGSALSKLTHGKKSFLYTGDFQAAATRLHKGAELDVGKIDYVLIESTYGDRNHPSRKEEEKAFCESVQDTVERGGWAIVPAFAVGRSQEMVEVLHNYNINAPIYLDGMSQKVSQVYLKHLKEIRNPKDLKGALKAANWITHQGLRAKALEEPSIIVTTSGMMQGGPIMGYVEKIWKDPNSKIHLTGYQVEGTPGRHLMDEGRLPIGKNGSFVKVGCQYQKYDFSAHADQNGMIQSLKKWSPKEVFLVHGDKEVMPVFAKKIKEETGIKATILKRGKEVGFE